MYDEALRRHRWLLGIERFDPSEYHPEDLECIPEIGLDDGEDDSGMMGDDDRKRMTLTLTNIKDVTNICFVTVWDVDLLDGEGNILQCGWNETTQHCDGKATRRRKCTTFIVLCPPRTFVYLCYLAPNQFESSGGEDDASSPRNKIPITSWSQVEIENDIQPWSQHENVHDEHPTLIHFPFCGLEDSIIDKGSFTTTADDITVSTKSFQCIQSEKGQLTHFFRGNYHAIDFACSIGTPLYSPVNGVIVHVYDGSSNYDSGEDRTEVSGIAASNLFHWNSIMIQEEENNNDNLLYIEYVHIQSRSCVVHAGDRVCRGQLLCNSGSVGFSPTPHLHLGAYRSAEDGAASVRVRFECSCKDVKSFLPVTGGFYNEYGLVSR